MGGGIAVSAEPKLQSRWYSETGFREGFPVVFLHSKQRLFLLILGSSSGIVTRRDRIPSRFGGADGDCSNSYRGIRHTVLKLGALPGLLRRRRHKTPRICSRPSTSSSRHAMHEACRMLGVPVPPPMRTPGSDPFWERHGGKRPLASPTKALKDRRYRADSRHNSCLGERTR